MPIPTPCIESRTPSQSHNERPAIAPPTGPPGIQGSHKPYEDVPHHICAQRGASSPKANIGKIQEWDLLSWAKIKSITTQIPTKKMIASTAIAHGGAYFELQR